METQSSHTTRKNHLPEEGGVARHQYWPSWAQGRVSTIVLKKKKKEKETKRGAKGGGGGGEERVVGEEEKIRLGE